MKRPNSLKWQMLKLTAFTWIIPIVLLTLSLIFVVGRRTRAEVEKTILVSMEKAVEICGIRLQTCVGASKDASILPYLREIYEEYLKAGEDMDLRSKVNRFLEQQYKYNDSFRTTFLYFTDNPDEIYYMGSRSAGSGYANYVALMNDGLDAVRKAAEDLDTKTCFMRAGGRVYMVRNMMAKDFTPYAVIIMELDTEKVFGVLDSVWAVKGYEIRCGGEVLLKRNFPAIEAPEGERSRSAYLFENRDGSFIRASSPGFDQQITYTAAYDRDITLASSNAQILTFLVLLMVMVPFMLVMVHFLNRRVLEPVSSLAEAASKISDGNYGIQVEVPGDRGEISAFVRDFNEMSDKLKVQFEKIFVEEIALRDANIHALQSQINPHFLNNSLEIINWEARMDENEKVSLMIEALSTMLDATLGRDGLAMIPLKKELEYVEAYLYIISCRYGDRFRYSSDIDETLLSWEVPRLIIQPIIENAVEHGTKPDGTCEVFLAIRRGEEEGGLTISVKNSGELSEEDRRKIGVLLTDEDNCADELRSVEIGIRNVHRRLQFIYGNGSGLQFNTDNKGNTVCTIIIKNNQI